jgi:hypothetical protein
MKLLRSVCFVAASLLVVRSVFAQGFQNLDFESTTVLQAQPAGQVSVTNALPGWAAGAPPFTYLPSVGFNNAVSNGVYYTGVFLLGTNSGSVIEGGFSVLLQVAAPGTILAVSIYQPSLVPVGSQSLLFKAQPGLGSLELFLGGQSIPFFAESKGPNYTLYAGDVSAFAGQTVYLAFTAFQGSPVNSWILDSIQFSSSPIPEPSALSFLGILAFFLHCRMRRR